MIGFGTHRGEIAEQASDYFATDFAGIGAGEKVDRFDHRVGGVNQIIRNAGRLHHRRIIADPGAHVITSCERGGQVGGPGVLGGKGRGVGFHERMITAMVMLLKKECMAIEVTSEPR